MALDVVLHICSISRVERDAEEWNLLYVDLVTLLAVSSWAGGVTV